MNTSPLALGCMGMTGFYEAVDRDSCIKTIHKAFEQGITLPMPVTPGQRFLLK